MKLSQFPEPMTEQYNLKYSNKCCSIDAVAEAGQTLMTDQFERKLSVAI